MIRLDRGPAPPFFRSPEFKQLRAQALYFYSVPLSKRRQLRFNLGPISQQLLDAITPTLNERLPKKCAYCESPTTVNICVFRPRHRAIDLTGRVDDDHYWWLNFEWENYLRACSRCDYLKGFRFPVLGRRAAVGSTGDALREERALLLDPFVDEPERVLRFLPDGCVMSEDERGEITIDVLNLNRIDLVRARYECLRKLQINLHLGKLRSFTGRFVTELRHMTADESPYAGMCRQFIGSWAKELTPSAREEFAWAEFKSPLGDAHSLGKAARSWNKRTKAAESFSTASSSVSKHFYSKAQFVERIEFENIRGFEHLDLRLPLSKNERGHWYVLLGENGTGKSTVLQMVAAALIGERGAQRLKLRTSDYLRKGAARGQVRIHLTGMSAPIVMTLTRSHGRISIDPKEPKVMLLAYGATRLLPGRDRQVEGTARIKVDNLFDPLVHLSDGGPWLHQVSKAEFDRCARSLAALLPSSDGARFSRRGGKIFVETPGARDELSQLSSGYQAVVSLALDIMSVMRRGWQDMDAAEGIVLVDEVDAHLHPRWKMRIVARLREVFPRMQFIVTSHEPLTLRELDKDEIAVLRRSLNGKVSASTSLDEDLPSPNTLRVDQLLSSEYFGLHSTQDTHLDEQFEEYYTLLAMRSRSPQQEQRLAKLRDELEGGRQFGRTAREKLVLEAADLFLAQRKQQAERKPEQRAKAIKKLRSIWAQLPTNTSSRDRS